MFAIGPIRVGRLEMERSWGNSITRSRTQSTQMVIKNIKRKRDPEEGKVQELRNGGPNLSFDFIMR